VKRFALISIMALLLVACGFHLRGMVDMPRELNDISIVVQNANRDLQPLLEKQLQAYHIRVTNLASAQYWLIIEQDDVHQQITSISSSTTPRQYELIYTLNFKLQRAKGQEILPSTQIIITREATMNSDRILGSTSEMELLKRDMRREAVIQIIDRLSHTHDH
jgi:LPS-assembly lipoprotein